MGSGLLSFSVAREPIYHAWICNKREAGILVSLIRAIESLTLHIINSNICCSDHNILYKITFNGGGDTCKELIANTIFCRRTLSRQELTGHQQWWSCTMYRWLQWRWLGFVSCIQIYTSDNIWLFQIVWYSSEHISYILQGLCDHAYSSMFKWFMSSL